MRGNANQVHEKYLNLARDAAASGDRIAAESYYQFAEHYFRLLNDSTDPQRSGDQHRGGHRDRGPQHHRDGRPQGPPSEQPVVDMDFQPPAEGMARRERPRGPRTNGHDAPFDARPGDAAAGEHGGAGSAPARTEVTEAPSEAAETPAGKPAAAPQAVPTEQPVVAPREPEAKASGGADDGAEAGAEKRPPAKRRVARPRRKAANGTDAKASNGPDAKASNGPDAKAADEPDAKTEQQADESSSEKPDSDTATP